MKFRVNGLTSSAFWDKDCVVYHHESGTTHLINDVLEDLIKRCLSDIPYDHNELMLLIQQYLDISEQDLHVYLNQLLVILIKKDLIEQLN